MTITSTPLLLAQLAVVAVVLGGFPVANRVGVRVGGSPNPVRRERHRQWALWCFAVALVLIVIPVSWLTPVWLWLVIVGFTFMYRVEFDRGRSERARRQVKGDNDA